MQGIFYISDLMKLYPNLSVSSIEFSFRYHIFEVTDTLLVIVLHIVVGVCLEAFFTGIIYVEI